MNKFSRVVLSILLLFFSAHTLSAAGSRASVAGGGAASGASVVRVVTKEEPSVEKIRIKQGSQTKAALLMRAAAYASGKDSFCVALLQGVSRRSASATAPRFTSHGYDLSVPIWSKELQIIAMRDSFVWANCIKLGADVTNEDLAIIGKQCKYLEVLDLENCEKITDEGLRSIIPGFDEQGRVFGCARLQILNLYNCQNISGNGINFSALPILRGLNLSGSSVTDEVLRSIIAGCGQLEVLYLKDCSNIRGEGIDFSMLSRLRILDLSGTEITKPLLDSILSLSDLRALYLGGYKWASGLEVDFSRLKLLEILHFTRSEIDDAVLRSVVPLYDVAGKECISGCEYLRELNLAACLNIRGEGIDFSGLQRLEKLDLSRSGITDAGLTQVAKVIGLRELNLAACRNIRGGGIDFSGLCALEKLDLSRSGITDAGLTQVTKVISLRELILSLCSNIRGDQIDFSDLRALEKLDLSGSGITDKNIYLRIAKELPNNCRIIRNFNF